MALKGKTVAITRPEKQARALAELVLKEGGNPYLAPTIEVRPPKAEGRAEDLIRRLIRGEMDYVVFMSVNGVRGLLSISRKMGLEGKMLEALSRSTIVAVGPKTRDELEKEGIKVRLIPEDFSSKGVIRAFRRRSLKGKTVALPRTGGVSSYLKLKLEALGAQVFQASVYQSAVPSDRFRVLKLIRDLSRAKIDAIALTSPATARNLFQVAKENGLTEQLRDSLKRRSIAVLAIGLKTRRTLEKLGVKVHVTARQSTVEAMVKAYIDFLNKPSLHESS